MIGQRLKLARSAAGLSLRGLEEKIGNRVTAQAIGKYERNESMPGSGVLIALADALDVSVDYLVGDQEMILEAVEFRKKTITSKREECQVEATVLYFLEQLPHGRGVAQPSEWSNGIVRVRLPTPSCVTFQKPTAPPEACGIIGALATIQSRTSSSCWRNRGSRFLPSI